jgi:hypothetical protein
VIVADLLRDSETWLVDEGLTLSAEPGMKFASRLCWPADFAITCGVVVPVNTDLIEEILLDSMAWLRHVNLDKVADNPRFATAIYRAALNAGLWTAWCSNSSRWPPNQTQNGQSQDQDRLSNLRDGDSVWTSSVISVIEGEVEAI